jgi:hypothetical protein
MVGIFNHIESTTTAKGGGLKGRPLEGAFSQFVVFVPPLGVFLILYLPSYLVLIHPDCRDTVAAAPEVIPPVRLCS